MLQSTGDDEPDDPDDPHPVNSPKEDGTVSDAEEGEVVVVVDVPEDIPTELLHVPPPHPTGAVSTRLPMQKGWWWRLMLYCAVEEPTPRLVVGPTVWRLAPKLPIDTFTASTLDTPPLGYHHPPEEVVVVAAAGEAPEAAAVDDGRPGSFEFVWGGRCITTTGSFKAAARWLVLTSEPTTA